MKLNYKLWIPDTLNKSKYDKLLFDIDPKLVRPYSPTNSPIIPGVCVAGGSVRMMFQGLPFNEINDIDLWASSITEHLDLHQTLKEVGYYPSLSTQNSMSYRTAKKQKDASKVQIIHENFSTVDRLFSSFDITVAQIALFNGCFVYTEEFERDIAEMRLNFANIHPHSFLPRYLKYQLYGFTPPDNLLSEMYAKYGKELAIVNPLKGSDGDS